MPNRLTHRRRPLNLREIATTLAVFVATMVVVGAMLHVLWMMQ